MEIRLASVYLSGNKFMSILMKEGILYALFRDHCSNS